MFKQLIQMPVTKKMGPFLIRGGKKQQQQNTSFQTKTEPNIVCPQAMDGWLFKQ